MGVLNFKEPGNKDLNGNIRRNDVFGTARKRSCDRSIRQHRNGKLLYK